MVFGAGVEEVGFVYPGEGLFEIGNVPRDEFVAGVLEQGRGVLECRKHRGMWLYYAVVVEYANLEAGGQG